MTDGTVTPIRPWPPEPTAFERDWHRTCDKFAVLYGSPDLSDYEKVKRVREIDAEVERG